jgi:C1A family cysteine protease
MTKYVIDINVLHATKSWVSSLRPAQQYNPSDIGKTFWPPMNARLKVKVAPLKLNEFLTMPSVAAKVTLPRSFNWNEQPGVTLNAVQNQGNCGSCWAVSSATCIGDQWGIATKSPAVLLAANNITNCTLNEDCNTGGSPADAAYTAGKDGLVEDRCWPYSCDCTMQTSDNTNAQCTTTTSDCSRWYVQPNSIRAGFVLKNNVSVPMSVNDIDITATFDLIKHAIYTSGPVVTGFSVPSDLMSIGSDPSVIFRSNVGDSVGLHAVVITGWGYDNIGKLYWIIRNSWGTDWGQNGYFKVYAYDPEYPKNNSGFDVPLFQSETLKQAVVSAAVSGDEKNLYAVVQDAASGPYCGVTLWLPDRSRSPSSHTSLNQPPINPKIFHHIGITIGIVAIISIVATVSIVAIVKKNKRIKL